MAESRLVWTFVMLTFHLSVVSFAKTSTSVSEPAQLSFLSTEPHYVVSEPSTSGPEPGLPGAAPHSTGFTIAEEIASSNIEPRYKSLTFPVEDFFKIPEDAGYEFDRASGTFFLDTFVSKMTCAGGHCNKTCSCDRHCFKYRICCIDYLWNETTPLPLDRYLEAFVKESKQYIEWECKPLLQNIPGHSMGLIWMIASCPDSTLGLTSYKLCYASGSSNDINIPVIGSDGSIYRNQYCAICNAASQYQYLNISVKCESADNMTDPGRSFSNFIDCKFEAISPKLYPNAVQECKRVYHRECDRSNPNYDLCHAYVGEAGGGSKEFANVHCLWCNNASLHFNISKFCTDPQTSFLPYSFVISFTEGTQFSYRVDGLTISPGRSLSEYQGSKSLCSPGQTYEIGRAECVPFSCGFGYTQSGPACVKAQPSLHRAIVIDEIAASNTSFDTCLQSRGGYISFAFEDRNSSLQGVEKLKDYLVKLFRDQNITAVSFSSDNRHLFALYLHSLRNAEYASAITSMSKVNEKLWVLGGIKGAYITSERVHFTELYGPDFSRHFSSGICAESKHLNESEFAIDKNCTWRARLKNNSDALSGENSMEFLVYLRPGVVSKSIFVCKRFHLSKPCPLQVVPLSNITSIAGTSSIIAGNKTYHDNDYLPLESGIGICITSGNPKISLLPWWLETSDKVEYYLTITGIPLSAVCYAWIVMRFALIRELRNLPGYNLVALSVSLLLSDVVFLTISQVRQSAAYCKGLAIVLHWLLLLVQAWTGTTAFEVARTFASPIPMPNSANRRFALYFSVSLLLPTAIVIAMMAVDEARHLVGYGKEGLCWIYYFNARFYGYILIVIVVTASSTILVSFAVFKIYKQRRCVREALKESKRRDINLMKIALKLTLLVGIVEIVGLIQITSPDSEHKHAINATFRILYTFLRSFRGVLIWLSKLQTR